MKILTTLTLVMLMFFTSCEDPNATAEAEAAAQAAAQEATMTDAASNYLKAWSDNDHELMKSLAADDIQRTANGEVMSSNIEELAATMDFWHTAMPDFNLETNDIAINGSKAYTSWKASGTNTGPLGDAPAAGGAGENAGFTIIEFNSDGKVSHETAYYDLLGIMIDFGYTLTHPIEAE